MPLNKYSGSPDCSPISKTGSGESLHPPPSGQDGEVERAMATPEESVVVKRGASGRSGAQPTWTKAARDITESVRTKQDLDFMAR